MNARALVRCLAVALTVYLVVPMVDAEKTPGTRPSEITPARKTSVSIVGDQFFINGKPTYAGRSWRGHKVEGLLLNSRMVQGIFDDRNPQTVKRWAYPDTGKWDAERNT